MKKLGMRKLLSPEQARVRRQEMNILKWDEPDTYLYIKHLAGDRLRWEFLRRDENYRTKYWDCKKKNHPILGRCINPKKRGDELPEDFCFLDTSRRGSPLMLKPPPIKELLFAPKDEVKVDAKIYAHFGHQLEELYSHEYLVFAFDPTRSVKTQINEANAVLNDAHKQYQEKFPDITISRVRKPKDAIKLLRALDAALVGASNQAIGHEIFRMKKYESQISVGKERLDYARNIWRVM